MFIYTLPLLTMIRARQNILQASSVTRDRLGHLYPRTCLQGAGRRRYAVYSWKGLIRDELEDSMNRSV